MRFVRRNTLILVFAAACSDLGESPAPSAALATEPQAVASVSESTPIVFNVVLRSENEPNGASTSTSKGNAQVKVYDDGTMEFLITVNNKSDEIYLRSHIHKAAAGTNGPIHWDFLEAGNPVASLTGQPAQLRGLARPRAAAVLSDLLAHPENYYVNVHSNVFPGGAVRGQLQ